MKWEAFEYTYCGHQGDPPRDLCGVREAVSKKVIVENISWLYEAEAIADAHNKDIDKKREAIQEVIEDCQIGYEEVSKAIRDVEWLPDIIADKYLDIITTLKEILK